MVIINNSWGYRLLFVTIICDVAKLHCREKIDDMPTLDVFWFFLCIFFSLKFRKRKVLKEPITDAEPYYFKAHKALTYNRQSL